MSIQASQRFSELLPGYLDELLTSQELEEFLMLLNDQSVQALLNNTIQWDLQNRSFAGASTPEQALESYASLLLRLEHQQKNVAKQHLHKIHFLRTAWFRYAVAILIIITAGSGAYLWNSRLSSPETVQNFNRIPAQNDIEPGKNKAILTLADGSTIIPENAGNGILATQGNVRLVKTTDGQIEYKGTGNVEIYNTLTVPRGGKVKMLILSDGTRVWLNSESSLHYPTAFVEKDRRVEITGEAYFEVAKIEGKKFFVTGDGITTEVLGTHFNVNTYADEPFVKITLLEGKVKVSNKSASGILKPGQQALIDSEIKVVDRVDAEEVMAWKNGKFQFTDASIETIMKQVTRWYDAEVVYEGKISGNFVADISRNVPVSKLLNLLELTNRVHFSIADKKIIVKP